MCIKVIVAGSRTFKNYELLRKKLDYYLQNYTRDEIEIVCGKAKGADTLGEKYAFIRGIPIKYFPANWDKYGKSAGYKRNAEMAKYATHCIIFWNGISKGSKHMADIARENNLHLKIITY